jgi:ubiquinone biosynthesis protein UbiJ
VCLAAACGIAEIVLLQGDAQLVGQLAQLLQLLVCSWCQGLRHL